MTYCCFCRHRENNEKKKLRCNNMVVTCARYTSRDNTCDNTFNTCNHTWRFIWVMVLLIAVWISRNCIWLVGWLASPVGTQTTKRCDIYSKTITDKRGLQVLKCCGGSKEWYHYMGQTLPTSLQRQALATTYTPYNRNGEADRDSYFLAPGLPLSLVASGWRC